MKTIKYFFEFITVITLFFIFKIIGLKNASNLGGMMGKVFGPLFRSKSITKKNIKIVDFKCPTSNMKKKNDWRNLLSPEIEKNLREVFFKEMKELGYI